MLQYCVCRRLSVCLWRYVLWLNGPIEFDSRKSEIVYEILIAKMTDLDFCFSRFLLSRLFGSRRIGVTRVTTWPFGVTWHDRSLDYSISHIGGLLEPSLYIQRFPNAEILSGEWDATVDMTLSDLYAKVKVIHFGTDRSLIYTIS